jgi:hypothetical protein
LACDVCDVARAFRLNCCDYTEKRRAAAVERLAGDLSLATADLAFYCVADSNYFLGLVGLLNSLRLVGHHETVFVLDRGLQAEQRERLAPLVEFVEGAEEQHPILSKSYAPLQFPADLMVLLDVDMIVTQNFAPLTASAAEGCVVAFADRIYRFDPHWEKLLGLPPIREGTYVNAGFLAFPRDLGLPLLERVRDAQQRVQVTGSRLGRGRPADPFFFPDQDAWNAVLNSCIDGERLRVLENRLAPFPPFSGVTLEDARRLSCRYDDGVSPFLLHYVSQKPWLSPTASSIYTKLLTRLLLSDDVPLRVRPEEIPRRLRTGVAAKGAALVATGVAGVASQRGKLGIRRRIEALGGLRKSRYSGER